MDQITRELHNLALLNHPVAWLDAEQTHAEVICDRSVFFLIVVTKGGQGTLLLSSASFRWFLR